MLRKRLQAIHPGELLWFVPYLCIGLISMGLLRSLPQFSPPPHSRTVLGADGVPVQIALPFRGTVLTCCATPGSYLATTRSPETLLIAGGNGHVSSRPNFAKSPMSWVYPQVLQNRFWDLRGMLRSHGAFGEIESFLSYDSGVYFGGEEGPMALLRSVGLPALYANWHDTKPNEGLFAQTRVASALVGQPERGEALIARYRQANADLEQELQPASIANKLRVLYIESSKDGGSVRAAWAKNNTNTLHAGLRDATEGYYALTKRTDVERILAMDPDIIIRPVGSQSPQDFMNDPRWRGLKAVRERRVYLMPGTNPGDYVTILTGPLFSRWMAELAYPERMQPKVRQMWRETFIREFGYRLSDDQIDLQLQLKKNSSSAGYERFIQNYQANKGISK